jgi:hypothetical protein
MKVDTLLQHVELENVSGVTIEHLEAEDAVEITFATKRMAGGAPAGRVSLTLRLVDIAPNDFLTEINTDASRQAWTARKAREERLTAEALVAQTAQTPTEE